MPREMRRCFLREKLCLAGCTAAELSKKSVRHVSKGQDNQRGIPPQRQTLCDIQLESALTDRTDINTPPL